MGIVTDAFARIGNRAQSLPLTLESVINRQNPPFTSSSLVGDLPAETLTVFLHSLQLIACEVDSRYWKVHRCSLIRTER